MSYLIQPSNISISQTNLFGFDKYFAIFKKLYDALSLTAIETSLPSIILSLADYQYKAAFVADQELNMVACLTEVMSDVEFK